MRPLRDEAPDVHVKRPTTGSGTEAVLVPLLGAFVRVLEGRRVLHQA